MEMTAQLLLLLREWVVAWSLLGPPAPLEVCRCRILPPPAVLWRCSCDMDGAGARQDCT